VNKEKMKYKTIYADPPWSETGAGQIKRGADKHYSLMKTPEIIEYMKQISVEDNAHLYLWVTNNHLKDGLQVMESLGFRYITNIVWVKDRFGLGQYFRGMHEICLFGVKGNLPYKHKIDPSRSCCTESTVIHAKRTEHSKKPTEMYSKIENTSYPPFLEVFARCRRDGWDVMGNEVQNNDIWEI
jgi:N6-adenosine-specific RNA methylase IME4